MFGETIVKAVYCSSETAPSLTVNLVGFSSETTEPGKSGQFIKPRTKLGAAINDNIADYNSRFSKEASLASASFAGLKLPLVTVMRVSLAMS